VNYHFHAVSQKKHMDGFVRDALISGISSHAMHQCLFEESVFSVDDAFEKTRALDTAQTNSETYAEPGMCCAADAQSTTVTLDYTEN